MTDYGNKLFERARDGIFAPRDYRILFLPTRNSTIIVIRLQNINTRGGTRERKPPHGFG